MTKRALISVSDKTNIVSLVLALVRHGYEIISTGGTAKLLHQDGIKVTEVSNYTGMPEALGGRIKTLHPSIAGGLLANWKSKKDRAEAKKLGIEPIQIVVNNFYPFEKEPSIETIDIGGPTMIRAAAKNYQSVAVITDPGDYDWITTLLDDNNGELPLEVRKELAMKVFEKTSAYDSAIASWLGSGNLQFTIYNLQKLRYGENPHQKATLYQFGTQYSDHVEQLQGKELSYNNILDMDAAVGLVNEFDKNACAIIKHNNPCGVALGKTAKEAYTYARETDPVSAFGGVIAFNCEVDQATAQEIVSIFVELVSAPLFTKEALVVLATKKAVRVLVVKPLSKTMDIKSVAGGLLVQTPDSGPEKEYPGDLGFAWKVAKHVKSNAIVFAKNNRTCGIGAGQMSRIDSTRLAIMKAKEAGFDLKGSVVASDGFFPFPDGVEAIAKTGATAIIQPGGSIKDDEVIAIADKLGITMVTTGVRHFRH